MFKNNIYSAYLLTLIFLSGTSALIARENVPNTHHKAVEKIAASGTRCQPGAINGIDLDINNVRAKLMTGGDMWWDIGSQSAAYEIPKGSGKCSQFAASCWIGGYDAQGQLKVAAQTYRQDGNDYWPGALQGLANAPSITYDVCANWDRFWKVDRATINQFIELSKNGGNTSGSQFDAINQWPGRGSIKAKGASGTSLGLDQGIYAGRDYAPFVDLNGDGFYQPDQGEYPLITGDEYIWWVFNDAGNVKLQTQTASIGVEIQTSAFAYSTQDFLNDATFCQYRVINRGVLTMDSTYIAVWDDCDLGYAFDDFIGCDTSRGLGIQYNGTNDDGAGGGHPTNSYGPYPPQVGLDFFQGPVRIIKRQGLPDTTKQLGMTNFTYYNNDWSSIGNPINGIQIYGYMTGSIKDGERFSYDYQGPGIQSKGYGSGPTVNAIFTGDPGTGHDWSECTCNNNPGDRRFIFSSGPFQLFSGAKNDIIFGCIWAAPPLGGCPVASFKTITTIDDGAQDLFNRHFKTIEGPEAPRMVCRELDRRLLFYLVNDPSSNNYNENYGRSDGTYVDSLQYHQIAPKTSGIYRDSIHVKGTDTTHYQIAVDSLYHFQGYRVFQLANSNITSAQIFNSNTGEVDPAMAAEVFECDIKDGVTKIVNWHQDINVSGYPWIPQIKVTGKDSGIVHSFEITQDMFATGSDKRLVNYRNYYFVAIAYGYNNSIPFNAANFRTTQDQAYISSNHAAGGTTIVVSSCMPNPSNGAMGTVINSDFGSGVVIHRIEGVGNGGNFVQLDSASEATAVNNNKVDEAVYIAQQGPIDVKVIDPVKVPAYDWILQIRSTDTFVSNKSTWVLTAMNGNSVVDTIISEENISLLNEQIIEKYGLSVSVQQQIAPGSNSNGNGYLSSDVTFDDPSKPWLSGVNDQADSTFANWLRCGNNSAYKTGQPCNFNDNSFDTASAYENMLANYTQTKSTWAPYDLAATWENNHSGIGSLCGFEIAYSGTKTGNTIPNDMKLLPDVNVVFTSDKSKWTKCAVIELQEDTMLSQKHAPKFWLRRHRSWNGEISNDGISPIYAESDSDVGMSLFPGYAIDEGTGKRLNIVFGEDSYLANDNGSDMLWNPSPNLFNFFDGSIEFGGKHAVYILGTAYDSDKAFVSLVSKASLSNPTNLRKAYIPMQWIGFPRTNFLVKMNTLAQGYIPTKTTLRFRVTRPYAKYYAVGTYPTGAHGVDSSKFPFYTFSTKDLAPSALSDTTNRNALLNRIFAVPNPYYGYSGYEQNRYDTKVRIINLPARASIYIYALDGTLIRNLSKDDPNVSFIDWDIRNSVGLPIASGMYLIDVKAEGIGETVLKWFGATRPIDITTY